MQLPRRCRADRSGWLTVPDSQCGSRCAGGKRKPRSAMLPLPTPHCPPYRSPRNGTGPVLCALCAVRFMSCATLHALLPVIAAAVPLQCSSELVSSAVLAPGSRPPVLCLPVRHRWWRRDGVGLTDGTRSGHVKARSEAWAWLLGVENCSSHCIMPHASRRCITARPATALALCFVRCVLCAS